MMEQPLHGLTSEKAKELQQIYGKNELTAAKRQNVFSKILHVFAEPMFVLLIAAAVIYFIFGQPRDGAVMLIFVLGMIGIEAVQEWKTDKTLNALKDLSAPHITVLRDGGETTILSADLVPGDVMLISEGVKIPADGAILRANDLCVDESTLTGESEGVWKTVSGSKEKSTEGHWRRDTCYAGTLVTQGSAYVRVEQIGARTEYGKIGKDVAEAPDRPTPLEKQTASLVKLSAGVAAVLFALVSGITYFNLADLLPKDRIVDSILSGITLAMAMIPEEFPVILTVFLSMGAWRLAKRKSLVRRLPAVETLGAVSVLCVDKTGTITLNQMTVCDTWTALKDTDCLCETMGLACESQTYDPMEQAMLSYCSLEGVSRESLFSSELLAEYPFTNDQKMMGHVWKRKNRIVLAAKGSPERILTLCSLDNKKRREAEDKVAEMSDRGLRVIAVGTQEFADEASVPAELTDCSLTLCGLVGLTDPPRDSIKEDIARCRRAGVRVVMITGDNGRTASAIASQVGIPHAGNIITGDELSRMSDEELCERVRDVSIFSRVVPEHKMRIVKAFQQNGEIVAMTGDGVNDAPALKYANIGIAMGGRGSEVSREAADLVLLDDNFSTIVDTVRDGRRIYDNIRKAIGYVFTIHIPIAFASLLAPMLGIGPSGLMLLPLHVVLLELVIDPTCSIVLERQPAERDIMERRPRGADEKMLTPGLLTKSLLQGFVIFLASFGCYYFMLRQTGSASLARAMGVTVILIANVLLVQENSSRYDFIFRSLSRLKGNMVIWLVSLGIFVLVALILYTPLAGLLKFTAPSPLQFLIAVGIAFASVLWYEFVKLYLHLRKKWRIK